MEPFFQLVVLNDCSVAKMVIDMERLRGGGGKAYAGGPRPICLDVYGLVLKEKMSSGIEEVMNYEEVCPIFIFVLCWETIEMEVKVDGSLWETLGAENMLQQTW